MITRKISKRRKFFLLVVVCLSLMPLSCTLNPLNGFLKNINVQILSVAGLQNNKVIQNQPEAPVKALFSVPTSIPTSTAVFDCIAFSVTGFGIDEKEDVIGSEVPIADLRLGMETPMQSPTTNPGLVFTVKVPTLLGVDVRLQKRQIQVFGVYTSLTNKSSCQGKILSDFLVKEDIYAAVYLIGSDYYPNNATCTEGSICIVDNIAKVGADYELIFKSLTQRATAFKSTPDYVFTNRDEESGIVNIFSDSDLYIGRGFSNFVNSGTFVSKPNINNFIARIDLYFPFSKYLRSRVGTSVDILFDSITAPESTLNGSLCNSTAVVPTNFSNVRIKIWDGLNLRWANPPRYGSSGNLDITPANATNGRSFLITGFDLDNDVIQSELIDGKEYIIVSIRSLQPSCSSIVLNFPHIHYY